MNAADSAARLQMELLITAWAGRQLTEHDLRALIREYRHRSGLSQPTATFEHLAQELMTRIEGCEVKWDTFPAAEQKDRVHLLIDALWQYVIPAVTNRTSLAFRRRIEEFLYVNYPNFNPRDSRVFALAEAAAS